MKFIALPQELQCEVMQQCSSGNLSRLGISNITFATECRMKYLTSSCSPNLKRYVCSRRDAVPILYRDLDLSYCIVPAIFYSYPEDVIGEANRPDRRINSTQAKNLKIRQDKFIGTIIRNPRLGKYVSTLIWVYGYTRYNVKWEDTDSGVVESFLILD